MQLNSPLPASCPGPPVGLHDSSLELKNSPSKTPVTAGVCSPRCSKQSVAIPGGYIRKGLLAQLMDRHMLGDMLGHRLGV